MADSKLPAIESKEGKTQPDLTPEQFDAFMLDGKMPAEREPDPKAGEKADDAEAAAAKPVDQAASTDAKSKPAPEAGDSTKKPTKQPGQKKNASDRATELEAEATAAEERLQKALERRRRATEAADAIEREEPRAKRAEKGAEAAAAAPEVPAWKKYAEMPGAPKPPSIDDPKFKGIDDYMAAMNEHTVAMGHFIAEKIAEEKFDGLYDKRSKAEQEAASRDQDFYARAEASSARMDQELEADPEIIDRIPQRWKDLSVSDRRKPDEPMTAAHFVKDQVLFNCDHPLQVSEALCKDNFAELSRIARMSPERIIREVALLDSTFTGSAGSANTSDEAPADQPAHPRISKAAAPGKALGKKAASGVDPLKKAIEENDFDTFNALESSRERAASR